jgi:hypothetical protein
MREFYIEGFVATNLRDLRLNHLTNFPFLAEGIGLEPMYDELQTFTTHYMLCKGSFEWACFEVSIISK